MPGLPRIGLHWIVHATLAEPSGEASVDQEDALLPLPEKEVEMTQEMLANLLKIPSGVNLFARINGSFWPVASVEDLLGDPELSAFDLLITEYAAGSEAMAGRFASRLRKLGYRNLIVRQAPVGCEIGEVVA